MMKNWQQKNIFFLLTVIISFCLTAFIIYDSGVNWKNAQLSSYLPLTVFIITLAPFLFVNAAFFIIDFFSSYDSKSDDFQKKIFLSHLFLMVLAQCALFSYSKSNLYFYDYVKYQNVNLNCKVKYDELRCVQSYFRCGSSCQKFMSMETRKIVTDILIKQPTSAR